MHTWQVIIRRIPLGTEMQYSVSHNGQHVPGCPWFSKEQEARRALFDLRRADARCISSIGVA